MFVYKNIITERKSLDKLKYKNYCNYMKKNVFISLFFEILFIVSCVLLIIFCMPEQIPMHINILNHIDSLFSKWHIVIGIILSIIFVVLMITIKQKSLAILIKVLWFLTIFETLLISLYYSLENSFCIGDIFKIPFSVIVGLPISLIIIAWSNILKNIPYKSKLGIKNKYTLETEFLWTQIHYDAKNKFFVTGFILMIISIIFCFIKQNFIFIIIILLTLIATHLLLFLQAKSQYNKYIEMKRRKEKQQDLKEKTSNYNKN